jgi:hypothetical protein
VAVNIEAEIKRLNERIARLTRYARKIDDKAFDHSEGGKVYVAVPKELFEGFIDQFDLHG